MIQNPENLAQLMLFFTAVYWFFRWVVYDMNRPTEERRRPMM